MNINDYTPILEGKHPEFVSREKKNKHIGKNSSGHYIRQFKVDGCVFKEGSEGSRCDYLLLNDDCQISFFIELKGSDIEKAIDQIEETIKKLEGYHKRAVYKRIIFTSGSHGIKNSKVIKWCNKNREYAIIYERQYSEELCPSSLG